MSWNHRVVRRHFPECELLGIHEVYYRGKKPWLCTQEPVGVSSDGGLKDLRWMIDHMKKALGQPILDYDKDFTGNKCKTKTTKGRRKKTKTSSGRARIS